MIYVLFSGGASPSPTGTTCRIRRTAIYHQGNALYIITPWCVSFHNIRVANISLAVRQISLTLGEYRVFAENISPHRKVPAVRKKAPSGRELAAKQTEGERDRTTYHKAMVYAPMVYTPMLHAISFRLAMLDTSLPEGGNREEQAPPLPAQRAVSAARRYIIKAASCISSHLGVYIIAPQRISSYNIFKLKPRLFSA